jgi:ABC-type multidrug transport system fused ATPase/permease subunit
MVGAICMVFLSAVSLSAGLFGALPVVESIIGGEHKELATLAHDWNAKLGRAKVLHEFVQHFRLPDEWIARLPAGPFTALASIMGALCLLAVFGSFTTFLHAYLSLTIVNRTVAGIRREAFHAIVRSPLARMVNEGATDAVSRIVNDTRALGDGLNMLLSKGVLQVFKGIAAVLVALAMSWPVTLISALVAPILYTIIRRLGKKIKKGAGRALESQSELLGIANETLGGLRAVKVNTAERLAAGRFHRVNKRVLAELNKVRTARAIASPLTEMLSIFLLCGLVLAAGHLIIHSSSTFAVFKPEQMMLALGSLAVAGASLKPLTGIINDIQAAAPAAERVADLLAMEQEPGHGPGLAKLPRHAAGGAIQFRDVSFSYRGQSAPALRQVSLEVPHGRRVAVVGPNGCGKTTLLGLVPRLFDPQAGNIFIDGINVRDVSVRSLRSQIGVVTQETVLFRGTIRENIALGAEGVTDDRIIAAARRARAHDFIMALPSGYDTPVAEQGLSLSGGQRQRIAIARAILRDPAILILDEATSMIDAESESHIAVALNEFCVGRTCLIVAHRLATVIHSDLIVVMDAGQIVDQGRHDELIQRCAVYRSLVQHQFGIDAT